jgi:tetratricopeptide (TPR) repeat protein
MKGDGLATVAEQLPKYLPALETLAQQPSRYQKIASRLATQGCLLMSLIASHRLNLSLREHYCQRAERYSQIADDQELYVTALTYIAYTFYLEKSFTKSVFYYEKAISIISNPNNQISPLLRNKVFVEAAVSYAQIGQIQDALRCLGKARETFPQRSHDEPIYVSTDHGMLSALCSEGKTYELLGELMHDQGMPKRSHVLYIAAQNAFAQLKKLDPTITVPERGRIEIVNHWAATAMALNDMDTFQVYLIEGIQRARAIGSDRRMQEAIANWKAARKRWPHEQRVLELADVLL